MELVFIRILTFSLILGFIPLKIAPLIVRLALGVSLSLIFSSHIYATQTTSLFSALNSLSADLSQASLGQIIYEVTYGVLLALVFYFIFYIVLISSQLIQAQIFPKLKQNLLLAHKSEPNVFFIICAMLTIDLALNIIGIDQLIFIVHNFLFLNLAEQNLAELGFKLLDTFGRLIFFCSVALIFPLLLVSFLWTAVLFLLRRFLPKVELTTLARLPMLIMTFFLLLYYTYEKAIIEAGLVLYHEKLKQIFIGL
ncbi:MAG: flagellar biosynthetic protein FliR [Deltaproteobacteria bacterium]|jgi:flagellar biosynthesis protein FliR|nr:flagellar biosynthetic protein FliR [Deltaproteobacteria bacterium]